MRVAVSVIGAISVLAYPFLVYYALTHGSARVAGSVLLLLLVPTLIVRLRRATKETLATVLALPATVIAFVSAGAILNNHVFFLVLPTLINLAMLVQFARTLSAGPPMIERFARMTEPELSEDKVLYCRRVTVVWCIFFAMNAAIAGTLALVASLSVWSFYTGIVNYVAIGTLFAVEYVVRKARFRSYGSALHDRVFAAIFPPP